MGITPTNIGALTKEISRDTFSDLNNVNLVGHSVLSNTDWQNMPPGLTSGTKWFDVYLFGYIQLAVGYSERPTLWVRTYTNNEWTSWYNMATRVKGNAESNYRNSEVNLTPENIGAPETIKMFASTYKTWESIYNKFISIPAYSAQNIYLDSAVAPIVTANASTPINTTLFGTIIRTVNNDVSSVRIFARSLSVSDVFSINLISMTASSQGTTNIYKISGTTQ